jgi:murein endopeptidase
MPRRVLLTALVILCVRATPARAEDMLVVENGQTLGKIAKKFGCSVEQLQRANDLSGSMIYTGQTLVVPKCKRKPAAITTERAVNPEDYDLAPTGDVRGRDGQSIGKPWDGELDKGVQLPKHKGYVIRRPARSWGASHVITQVQRAVRAVRKRFPRVHALAIGDLSAKHGGAISDHHSHQSGRDVDIGLYFKKRPKGYPEDFIEHDAAQLDLAATWALVYAFARTAEQANGVQVIFLDRGLQKRLYVWAKDHGVPEDLLDRVFQYPDDAGIVRHEPNHGDHLHVRFKCADVDDSCER